jgi:hypothetical protein
LSTDQVDAIDEANSPSITNPVATMADIGGGGDPNLLLKVRLNIYATSSPQFTYFHNPNNLTLTGGKTGTGVYTIGGLNSNLTGNLEYFITAPFNNPDNDGLGWELSINNSSTLGLITTYFGSPKNGMFDNTNHVLTIYKY